MPGTFSLDCGNQALPARRKGSKVWERKELNDSSANSPSVPPWMVTWKLTGIQTNRCPLSKVSSPDFLPGWAGRAVGWEDELSQVLVMRYLRHVPYSASVRLLCCPFPRQPTRHIWKFLLEDPEIGRMEMTPKLTGENFSQLFPTQMVQECFLTSSDFAIFVIVAT